MTRAPLSAHFAAAEFDCHDGTEWPPAARDALRVLCSAWLEPIRYEFGAVRVTSGYRTEVYNRKVGGAPLSYHRYDLRYGGRAIAGMGVGVAADIVPATGTPAQWKKWADRHLASPSWRAAHIGVKLGSGRGAATPYPRSGFIHLDTGPRRSWAG